MYIQYLRSTTGVRRSSAFQRNPCQTSPQRSLELQEEPLVWDKIGFYHVSATCLMCLGDAQKQGENLKTSCAEIPLCFSLLFGLVFGPGIIFEDHHIHPAHHQIHPGTPTPPSCPKLGPSRSSARPVGSVSGVSRGGNG